MMTKPTIEGSEGLSEKTIDELNELVAHIFGIGEDCAKSGVMNGLAYEEYLRRLEALIHAENVKARINELELVLEAGDGQDWDSQMAGAVGQVARRYKLLTATLKDKKELS